MDHLSWGHTTLKQWPKLLTCFDIVLGSNVLLQRMIIKIALGSGLADEMN